MDFFRRLLGQRVLNYYHLATAIAANIVYGFPSRKLRVIGVTGTDGKTTTVNMIASILENAGEKVAFLSTINAKLGNKFLDTGPHTTTPSPFFLQKFLSQSVRAGLRFAVLEVTSHSLDQFRTWGIRFETAVLTNISHEHLDYHKDLASYMAAKARLFGNVEYRILNMEDSSFDFFSTHGKGELLTYGLNSKAVVWANNPSEELTETEFTAHTPRGEYKIKLHLPGKFNVYNALAAIVVGQVYKIPADKIKQGLSEIKGIAGRLEMVGERVMVDFAHTPNALEKLLEFLRPKVSGKIILIFGSAGERDKTKRPLMGAVADKYADLIILTREDNRGERVEEICEQIAAGINEKQKDKDYFIILDRREAIGAALKQAQGANDFVIISGKGHEQSLNIDGKETPWDDRRVVREILNKV
ncbi:MAG: hypothetical protein A2846_02900 [Candidatus Doudnabacteria bacterium RIFCSPHIGHO2_01_FULL_49_9]|uniref:UDP-N-acetylmuramyl-tripeptide synthetase n=1 Tax=Candidatus Doudnabacteria bacterium RIFCSPHIGHO2_01_FULL_49_9 TaxID=1817827 RepID=A0A1F5NY48_9BACT|nr:MAG: hypothetical protein A2846_02900 [Candidatus Doudnabacteria bacterium RIFCSPHIGHO2_01_FULL_49_9]